MLWRNVIVLGLPLLLLAVLIACLLIGLHPTHIMDGPDMEFHGEETVPAENSKPDGVGDFDGTWLTRGGATKLVIRGGKVDLYRKDGESGGYRHIGACKMEFDENGDRALHPEKGENSHDSLGYSVVEKKGKLLCATVPMTDAAADVFASEGHEEDLPGEPV